MEVLVLNNDYSPISVTDMVRGFKLVFKGKAEVIEHDEENPIVTENSTYKRPSVIRLLKYIVLPFKKLKPTRGNVFKRDNYECLYCGSKKNITWDHVFPKCRGGQNTWENLATCCLDCNNFKGGRTPEEANMKLKYKPYKPKYSSFLKNIGSSKEDWKVYLF